MHRLLVANRGEIACRIIRAAQSLSIPTVAVYSDADHELPHVAMADEAVQIGPAPARDSYLNASALLDAARTTGCTMVHPGYGFLSENAEFAGQCVSKGLIFVGPDADHIRLMGDKQNARAAAEAAGVPVLPGTARLPEDPEWIGEAARRIGFPLLVKAVAGGGGHGLQQVDGEDALLASVERTRAFATRIFHDDGVYLEQCLVRARHVEVQLFGLGRDGAVHLFERDCSLQRRHQKVIEEAPAPAIAPDIRARMGEVSLNLARSIGYSGAGTMEFLYNPGTGAFYFLEMNTRIQVEHPVTEAITGIDLVAAQIRQARGDALAEELRQQDIAVRGAAIEARLYAENPAKRFLPSPGVLDRLQLQEIEGIRYDTGYREGNEIGTHYDPLILKVIASGEDRAAALSRLVTALQTMEIAGVTTNRDHLVELLTSQPVCNVTFHTKTIEDGI